MKKILHLNASSSGGAFIAANRLSKALNQTGLFKSEHLVFSGSVGDYQLWSNTWFKRKYAFLLHALEKLDFLRFEKDKSIRFAFSHGLTGIPIHENPLVKDAEIIHLHWINKGFISLSGLHHLFELGKPIVWTAHDFWPITGGCYHPRGCVNYEVACQNCKYLKEGSDLASGCLKSKSEIYKTNKPTIVVPGEWMYNQAISGSLSKLVQLRTIPNFIDTNVFSPGSSDRKNKDKTTILFSAFNLLSAKKGLTDFANAINSLGDTLRKNIRVVLVGGAKGMIPEINCEYEVTGIIQSDEEMVRIYRNADLMVIPSYEETFGLTAVESQACGVPTLAYASGQLTYNVKDGITGWLCDTGDVKSLSSKLESFLYSERSKIELMQRACRDHAVKNFDMAKVVKDYVDLYESIEN